MPPPEPPNEFETSQTLAEQSLETPLRTLALSPPVGVPTGTPLAQALALMHERGIGSILVFDADQGLRGILTRHDVLGRITLPGLDLATPIDDVMTQPVHGIEAGRTVHEASLDMARRRVRHLPVTEGDRVIGLVSERDLFALQRLSLQHVSSTIRAADDLPAMQLAAREIRRFAQALLEQGVGPRRLTELISHLNDRLTARLVETTAAAAGLDLQRACWLAFGSEGRSEQTIATDQDNGLVFDSDAPERDRPRWLAFARQVNEALDACGYPLCRGNVMASNPACCLTADEWCARFEHWMAHGAPEDLLAASIYFDLRPLAGRLALAEPLRTLVSQRAPQLPRFAKQMADNALSHRAPLNWRGAIAGARIDLKLQGTAIFVDAARLYALVHGTAATNTRERFEAMAQRLGTPRHEAEAWVSGFEFLQMLRLRVQIDGRGPGEHVNELEVEALDDLDRRTLREALRVAKGLQQRLELDYER